jgi:hypothetical protein
MTREQLYGDWTRRNGVTFKELTGDTWTVRGKDAGKMFYSRSVFADGVISTVELSYDPAMADALDPIVTHIGASLTLVPGIGVRANKN